MSPFSQYFSGLDLSLACAAGTFPVIYNFNYVQHYLLEWQDLVVSWNMQQQPHYFPSSNDEKFSIHIGSVRSMQSYKDSLKGVIPFGMSDLQSFFG